jgi:hypothetical protein
VTRLIIACASLTLAACGFLAPKPDLTRNYVLTEHLGASAADTEIALAVGPIDMPMYLDRAEIVTRVPPNTIRMSPLDRWAEPLRDNFARVLTADLEAATGSQNVISFPWHGTPSVDYRVAIDVEQFELRSDGVAVLVARWRLRAGTSGATVRAARSAHEVPIDGDDTAQAVEALSRAVALLAADIAAAIRR